MKKNNTWNIRRLVNETIVPATQRIILKIVGFKVVFNSICLMFVFSCIFWKCKLEKKSFMKRQKANVRSIGLGGSQKLKVESAEIINKTEMQILSKLLVYETFLFCHHAPCKYA